MFTRWSWLAVALLATPAWADDESAGAVPGAFRSQPAGGAVATSVEVVLDGEQVSVALAVTARAGTAIRLDLPRFAWLGAGEPYPDRHFPELAVDVDGHPAQLTETVVARAKGVDITGALHAARVNPFAIAQTPPFVDAAPGKQAAFDALVAMGAVARWPEGFVARWSASRSVGVALGAGTHVVTFRYTARPAFALAEATSANVRWADYCTTATAARRVLARQGLRGTVRVDSYTIPASLEGRPHVSTLGVSKEAAGATFVCGAHGTVLTDPAAETIVKTAPDGAARVLRILPPG